VSTGRIRGAIPPGILLVDCRATVINEAVDRWKQGEGTETDGERDYNKRRKAVAWGIRRISADHYNLFHLLFDRKHTPEIYATDRYKVVQL
jgi:hypothetical protein